MKRYAALCVLMLAACDEVFDLEAVAPPSDAPPSGLVAWFPMESSEGGTVSDVVGDHDGLCMSSRCPIVEPGIVGNALRFDGATNVVYAPSSSVLDTKGSFTVAVWVRIDTATAMSSQCPIGKRFGVQGGNTWQFCANSASWKFYGGGISIVGPPVTYGEWTHLAATWDLSTLELELYVNGFAMGTPSVIDVGFDDGQLIIGADIDSATTLAWFPGPIDEIRIYNRTLAGSEVLDLTRAN